MTTPLSPPRSTFVTVVAWLSLAMAALGVAGGLMQAVAWWAGGLDDQFAPMLEAVAAQGMLPPWLMTAFQHIAAINWISIAISAVIGVFSWGLLQRREWGRLGFIALLLLSGVAGLAAAWLFASLLDWSQAQAGAEVLREDLVALRLLGAMKAAFYIGMGIIALLHAGIAWKLHTPAIRAEFAGGGFLRR